MGTTFIKVQQKGAVTIPTRLRTKAGIAAGDMLEVSLHQGRIIFVPKVMVDRSRFPTVDTDYSPALRKLIDARLAKADDDIRNGRVHGPFKTHEEMIEFLHSQTKKTRATR